MKNVIRIVVSASEFGQEVFEDLLRSCPEASSDKFQLWFEGEVEDAATARILSCFERHGLTRWAQTAPCVRGREYVVHVSRRWEPQEIDGAEFLQLDRPNSMLIEGDGPRLRSQQLAVPISSLRRRATIVLYRAFLVPNRVKIALEEGHFVRLEFRPLLHTQPWPEGDPDRTNRHDQPVVNLKESDKWWEMTSPLILPPFEPPVEKHAIASPPIDKDGLGPLIPRTPGFDDFQARYRRSALRAAGPFDAAVSLEYAADPLSKCCFFVSQRLRKALLALEPSLTFTPMGIVEDL